MINIVKVLLDFAKDHPRFSIPIIIASLFIMLYIIYWHTTTRSHSISKDKLDFLFKFQGIESNFDLKPFILEQVIRVYLKQDINYKIIQYLLLSDYPSKSINYYKKGKYYTIFDNENGFRYTGDFNPSFRSTIYTALYFILSFTGASLLSLVYLQKIQSSAFVTLIILYSPLSILFAIILLLKSDRYTKAKFLVEKI